MKVEQIGMGTKPDPYNFRIVDLEEVNGNTIILAKYYGCTTYDGRKMMVLRGTDHKDRTTLDPHFLEGHPVVARFEPTDEGYKLAKICAKSIKPSKGEWKTYVDPDGVEVARVLKNELGTITIDSKAIRKVKV